MEDLLWVALRAVVMLVIATGGRYIYVSHKRDVRKCHAKAEEENRIRIVQNKPPLTLEDLRRVIARENIILSVMFGLVFSVVSSLVVVGLELVFG